MIFIILLLLLTIISVFGGSVRYSPDLLTSSKQLPATPSYPAFSPFMMGEGFYESGVATPKHATSSAPIITPIPTAVVAPVASVQAPPASMPSGAGIEPFQGAGEFAPF